MLTRTLRFVGVIVAALSLVACGSDVATSTGGDGGAGPSSGVTSQTGAGGIATSSSSVMQACVDPSRDCGGVDPFCQTARCDHGACVVENVDGGECGDGEVNYQCSNGQCVQCVTDQSCMAFVPPGQDAECVIPHCVASACTFDDVTAGAPTASHQASGDCKVRVCDGVGATREANDDTDAPDDMNDCTVDSCASGSAVHTPAAAGTECAGAPGAKVCGGGAQAGTCVECVVASDCPGATCDGAGRCVPIP